MIIELTEKEWIEVIKLVDEKSNFNFDDWNKYNDIKSKMIFQFNIQKENAITGKDE